MANSAVIGILRVLLSANTAEFEQKMKGAQQATEGVSKGFSGLARDLSGSKLVERATQVATAVEKIGGVSKLTERELKAVAAQITAATDKMGRLGQTVPPEIAKLSTELKRLETASTGASRGAGSLSTAWSGVSRLLPIASVAGLTTALIGLGKAAMDNADHLVTLRNQTGLSLDFLQRLQFIAGQTGTSLEALTDASFKLGVNISKGADATKDAIAALGLSFDQIKALRPEEQFTTVMRALEGMEDVTQRNALGVALFGKGFKEMAGAVAEGATTMAADIDTATAAQLEALERAGDAWERLKTQVNTTTSQVLSTFALWVEGINTAATKIKPIDWARIIGIGTLAGKRPEEILIAIGLGTALATPEAAGAGAGAPAAAAAQSVTDYTKALAAARKEVEALSAAQRTQLNAALKLGGEAAKDYAETIGLSDAALRLYQQGLAEATKAGKDHERTLKEQQQAIEAFQRSTRNLIDQGWAPFAATVQDAAGEIAAIGAEIGLLASGPLPDYIARTVAADAATRQWAMTMGATFAPAMTGFSGSLNQATEELTGGLGDKLKDTFAQLPSQILAAVQGGGSVWQTIGSSIGLTIGQSLGATLAKNIGGLLGKTLGNLIPGLGALLGPLLGKLFSKFGISPEIKAARVEVDKFQEELAKTLTPQQKAEAGGQRWKMTVIAVRDAYLATGRSAAEAERIVKQLWDTDHPERAKAAIEQINAVMDEYREKTAAQTEELEDLQRQHEALKDEATITWDEMQQAAEQYGVDLGALGPKFQADRIHASAQQIFDDFTLLTRSGADVGGVLFGMREEISALVRDAQKFGTAIPQNFKPLVEELLRSGNLLDENGEKLTDLGDLQFGDPIVAKLDEVAESMKTIADRIAELVNLLKGPLLHAIDAIPTDVDVVFTGQFIPPEIELPNVPALAAGGVVTSPTMALLGEQGPEAVIPLEDLGAGGSQIIVLPFIPFTDPQTAADEAARQFSRRVGVDSYGMRSTLERVIEDYARTYRYG